MNLPVIFVCENNLFSVYTHLKDRQPKRPLADLGIAHKLNTVTIDGSDVFEVADTFNELVIKAKNENQPSLIVLDTYRWREHCGVNFDDHLGYRDQEEFAKWKEKDPIDIAINNVKKAGTLNDSDIQEMQKIIKEKINKAFDLAEKAPLPTPEMAGRFVYAA